MAAPKKLSVYLTGGLSAPPAEEARIYAEPKSVRIKREYPIDVFAAQNLTPATRQSSRSTLKYVCPWHVDDAKGANLEVYSPGHAKYGHCHCYRCDNGGSVIDLAMAIFGVDAGEAMRRIENKTDLTPEKKAAYVARAKKYEKIAENKPEINRDGRIHAFALHAHQRLHSDVQVRAYLAARGLEGAIVPYRLGSSQLPDHQLPLGWDGERGRAYPMRSFREVPLKERPHESVARVVIPYLDAQGGGRVTYVNARAAGSVEPRHKYRKPSEVPPEPYLLDNALLEGEDIVMTEGEFDALSLLMALREEPIGVFAVPGIHCFPEAEASKLASRRVFIVTDNDAAGAEGRQGLTELIYGYAAEVYHIEVKSGFNDVNEMLVAHGEGVLRGWFTACVQRAVRAAPRRGVR